MRLLRLLLLVGAAALVVAGCGEAEENVYVNVGMKDNFFTREITRVEPGDTVRFVNQGDALHNAVAVDGSWSTGSAIGEDHDDLLAAGGSVRLSPDEPGVYRFYCTLHGTAEGEGMAAVLIVGDAEYAPPGEAARAEPVDEWSGRTRRVGAEAPHGTIQEAVDAAAPGDLVLVEPGVYPEQVEVTTPSVTIRGTDRDGVVIDGEGERPNGISVFAADGVAIENLTVRNATENGLFWTDVEGYRASYVTALDNEVYGIYAFDSVDGLFEHSYAAGSPDAGFYIGQCDPCDAAITDVVAEHNGLGYSGTNASGNLALLSSVWRHNQAGIVPNSLDSELLPPAHDVTIAGNLVHDNGVTDAPALEFQYLARGVGIALAGVRDATVTRNRVMNHPFAGVAAFPMVDVNVWMSGGTEVTDNVIEGSGLADVVLGGPGLQDDCVEGNELTRTLPPGLQSLGSCGGVELPLGWDLGAVMQLLGRFAEAGSHTFPINMGGTPSPPPQPGLPGGADAPVRPAVEVYASTGVDLADVEIPAGPTGDATTPRKELTMFGIPLAQGFWSAFFGLYGYLLPVVLLAAWVALALWDLARREDLSRPATVGWTAVVLLIPFLGPIAYHAASGSPIPRWQRWLFVGGGIGAYLVILAVGAVLGGIV